MKKLFSVLIAALFSVTMFADTKIYCKVDQGWWTAKNDKGVAGAVAAHYWTTGGSVSTTWPGVRMTAVEGEQNIWSLDIDPTKADSIMFVRVPATGDLADWGAKTKGQKFPADDNTMFTITNSTPTWGDPGCDGTWYKFVPGQTPAPAKFYVTGDAAALGEWNSAAIKSTKDTCILHLEAGSYKMKITLKGAWTPAEDVKGYSDLTSKEGMTEGEDNNICFTLAAASDVKVIYKTSPELVFKVEITAGGGGGGSSTGFYITGDSALVVDAGIGIGKKWNPDALKVEKDTAELSLKAAVTYTLKVTTAGTWGTEKGFSNLTETAKGLWKDKDNNICFALTAAGVVKVIYKAGLFKLEGAFDESKVPATPTLEDGYYLIGQNGWDESVLSANLKFAANPDTEGEFQLSATLVKDQEIKVVSVESNAIKTWYPDGMGNAYKVDADHAGAKTIFFRPAGNDDWKTFNEGGFFFIAANEGGGGGEEPDPQFDGKFYITGESLVGSWEPNALACENGEHTFTNLQAGDYKFKITVDGTWETAKGFSDLASRPKGVTEGDNNNICFSLTTAGNVKVSFNGSKISLEGAFDESKEVSIADGYYLIGQNGWSLSALDASLKFEANTGSDGEYKLDVTLTAGQELKVVSVENSTIKTWYPDGMGNGYTVDAAHAGAKTVYFRPAGNADWESFVDGGFFFIEASEQGIGNTSDGVKAVKAFENGTLVIIKNGVKYNAQGTVVR